MKKFNAFLFLAGTMSILVGCQDKMEAVQTVDWYVAHETERKQMLSKCANNPGELSMTPNCMNADVAANRVEWSKPINKNPLNLKLDSKMKVAQ